MADIPELLPCPVCSRQPQWRGTRSDYVRGIYRLQCLEGTHLFQAYGPSEDACIAAWNTRAAPPAMDREAVERVREAAYRQALEDVCNPLGYLQRMADAEGAKLSGMAYAIASDIGTIQRIAKEALSTLSADAIRQGEGATTANSPVVPADRLERLKMVEKDLRDYCVGLSGNTVKMPKSSALLLACDLAEAISYIATPASHASDGGKA